METVRRRARQTLSRSPWSPQVDADPTTLDVRDAAEECTSAWIQTIGSGAFDLTRPKPNQVDFYVMALVLARIGRFGGHTKDGVYSVAQHCHQGALAILRETGRRDVAAAYVIHDGHEYVLGDETAPLQAAKVEVANELAGDEAGGEFIRAVNRELKRRADSVIYPVAGLPWPLPDDVAAMVKHYDTRMCRTERDLRMSKPPRQWDPVYDGVEPIAGVDLSAWTEAQAAMRLYQLMCELLPALSC